MYDYLTDRYHTRCGQRECCVRMDERERKGGRKERSKMRGYTAAIVPSLCLLSWMGRSWDMHAGVHGYWPGSCSLAIKQKERSEGEWNRGGTIRTCPIRNSCFRFLLQSVFLCYALVRTTPVNVCHAISWMQIAVKFGFNTGDQSIFH